MNKLSDAYLVFVVVVFFLLVWLYSLLKKPAKKASEIPLVKKLAKCGHETDIEGEVTAFEQTAVTKMPVNEDGSVDYCLECIGKMAIRCAWCEEPIFIGDPITLYSPSPRKKDEFILPENAVIYDEEIMSVVGCGRTTCADTGADYAGFWIPGTNGKGKVHRRATMLEESVRDMQNGGTGIIVRNP